ARHGEINARRRHHYGSQTTQDRNNNNRGKDQATGAAEQDLARLGRKSLRRSDLRQRHEVNKSSAGENVNESQDGHAQDESARHGAFGILHLLRNLAEIPPTTK